MDNAELRDILERLRSLESRQSRLEDQVEHLLCVPLFDVSGDITSVGNMSGRWGGSADQDNA